MITKKNHPYMYDIKGKNKESLTIRKRYVEIALNSWINNEYNAFFCRQITNINYFRIELEFVNKELQKHKKL